MRFRIITDTREQRPYSFENSIRKALPSGDYSLEGLEDSIAIERKSLDDYISSVIHSGGRFFRELKRLQAYEFAAVVIEGSISDILSGSYKSKVSPESLFGLTVALIRDYHPVHILFAGDRPHAYSLTAKLLELHGEKYERSIA